MSGIASTTIVKRFFDRDAVFIASEDALDVEHLAHVTIHRYEFPNQD